MLDSIKIPQTAASHPVLREAESANFLPLRRGDAEDRNQKRTSLRLRASAVKNETLHLDASVTIVVVAIIVRGHQKAMADRQQMPEDARCSINILPRPRADSLRLNVRESAVFAGVEKSKKISRGAMPTNCRSASAPTRKAD